MTYPALIRESLTASRTIGLPFPTAWTKALEDHPIPEVSNLAIGWDTVMGFMEKHMRAAYEGRPGRAGTYRCPAPETSAIALSEPQDAPEALHCRWGTGCTRIATRGTFSKWWCEEHGAELERIAALPNPYVSPSEEARLARGRERAVRGRMAA